MDYQRIYDQIIDRAKEEKRVKVKGGVYYEVHHIIPRCMGGSDEGINIVMLTAREHFICHWLLSRANPDNTKLIFAFHAMTVFKSSKLQYRYTPPSRAVQEAKELSSEIKKGQTLEEKVGKGRADQIKKQYSDSRRGRVPWNRGISPKPESIEKTREKLTGREGTFIGKTHKESSKELMRKAKQGRYIGHDSPSYGAGRQIVELSTGFVGYMYDQQKQFNIPGNTSIYENIKRGKPFVIGKNKGLQFAFVEDQK